MAWQVRNYYVGKGGPWPQFLVTGSEVCSRREEHIAEGNRHEKLCGSGRFHWVWEDRLVENSRIQNGVRAVMRSLKGLRRLDYRYLGLLLS